MKKFLSILLVAVLIVTSMATVAFADGGSATASVSESQTVKAGQTVTLTVTVSGKFSNYEATIKAAEGLTITAISGITSNIANGKVAFSSAANNDSHSFKVTVKVADDIAPGSYKVTADVTYGSMIVPIEEDTEDGIPDSLVRVSLSDGSATLTVVCEHAWGEWTETKAPTCTEKGVETRTCSKCGEKETRSIDMIAHSFGEWTQTKAPTCTEKGEETRTCTVCGHSEKRDVEKLDHVFGEWTQTKAPTCTDKGEEVRTCTLCGHTEKRDVDALGHDWSDWTVVTEPTCTTDGLKTRKCARCGEVEEKVIPSAEGHAWGEWKQTKAPTCTEDGEKTRECSACGEKQTEVIKATGHQFEHVEWKYNETHHWHACSVCGAKCEHNSEHGPVTEWQIIKQPTAKETGLKQKFCETCGATVATEEIPANGEGTLDPVPPTGDPTGMIFGSMSILLLLLLAAALYVYKRKASAK